MLSNQARLTNHIMSLDEVDISEEAMKGPQWNTKSPMSGQGRKVGNELRSSRQRMLVN